MSVRRGPGKQFEYTNSGYVLLARVIEVITGESFHDVQKRRILDVLQMNDTTDSTHFNGSGNMKTSKETSDQHATSIDEAQRVVRGDGSRPTGRERRGEFP